MDKKAVFAPDFKGYLPYGFDKGLGLNIADGAADLGDDDVGAGETDLDLGHYERFIDENINKYSNLTTGKVYWNVLNKERRGEYLGSTVQVIPHVTNEIKDFVYSVAKKTDADVVITEIGGTIGDIESQPFLEAVRQISLEVGKENSLFIHVTLVPFLRGSDEHKSKPTQHSVKELQGMGVKPDIIILRCDEPLEESIFKKISMFCNVKPDCVIENITLPILYEAPIMLEKSNFSSIVCRELGIDAPEIDMTEWNEMLERIHNRSKTVTIGLVGKYVQLHDAYLSVAEALRHAGYVHGTRVSIKWIDSETVTEENVGEILSDCSGVIVPVTVALRYFLFAVGTVHLSAGLHLAGISSEAQRAALCDLVALVGQEVDYLVLRGLAELAGICVRKAADVAREFDDGYLHAEAYTEIGDVVLPRIPCRKYHSVYATAPEAAGDDYPVQIVQHLITAGFGERL